MSKKKNKPNANAKAMRRALQRLPEKQPASYSLDFPDLPDGVKPNGLAMDNSPLGNFGADCFFGTGFIGYPRLAELAQISEYRGVSETTANEMTRQWIEIKSVGEEDNSEAIKQIEECYERLNVRGVFRKAIETDGLFGRGQILVQIKDHDGKLANPLLLTEKTIAKGSLKALVNIEPMWTTPAPYNAIDPTLPDFYKPKAWYVMAQEIHASRLFTLISRPVPDMLKPAYNFGGVSMTQLMMPYVERWLRTVDSVSDLLHSFSLSGIKTDMSAILSGSDDGDTNIMLRAELYNRLRDNRGLMLLSKDEEEFFQFNTPLSGLDALLAQSQEQMAAPSHTPLVKLLGITPSGLNASTEGEIAVYYDYIRAMQENLLRDPLDKLLKLVQLHLFGKVNDNITFDFAPLQQMNETELSTIRKSDTDRDVAYIQAGVVSAEEVRGRLASEPDSGYNGIDVEDVPEMPDDGFSDGLNDGEWEDGGDPADLKPEPAQDAEWDESKHPRAENGQFGGGSGEKQTGKPSKGKIDLGSLFQTAISNSGGNAVYSDFAVIDGKTAGIVKAETGIDISGWKHSIGEADIRHILKKHGNEKTENSRGQRAVTQQDIEKLPEILSDFDDMQYSGTNEFGNETFLVKKRIDDEIYCAQEIWTGRKKMVVKSMWIKTAKKKP
nr:MAG TPA: portal [Caudoviricetes sp.]